MALADRPTRLHKDPWRNFLPIGLVVFLSTGFTLLALEAVFRLRSESFFDGPSKRSSDSPLELIGSNYPATYDSLLGYVPTPGAHGKRNFWRTEVTIDGRGFRANGTNEDPPGTPILAFGDSFTFGDEVDDDATWPAHLESILDRRVINAGVFGYGFDQIVLRVEQVTSEIPTERVIVSIVGDTIVRCQYSYRYAQKPFFEIVDGSLALRNVPVPRPGTTLPNESALERLARHSHLAHFVMLRLDPARWVIPETVRAHWNEIDVAQRLVNRLARIAIEREFRILFVAQWYPQWDNAHAIGTAEYARRAGLDVLIVQPQLEALVEATGGGLGAILQYAERRVRESHDGRRQPSRGPDDCREADRHGCREVIPALGEIPTSDNSKCCQVASQPRGRGSSMDGERLRPRLELAR